jgi:hypothetical protein
MFSDYLIFWQLSQKELWGLGSFVFVVFLAINLVSKFAPRMQELESAKKVIRFLEIVVVKWNLILVGIALIIISSGTFFIVFEPERSSRDLLLFVGTIFLYLAHNLRIWAVEKNSIKKRNLVRTMGVCMAFILIYIYLLIGAPNLTL